MYLILSFGLLCIAIFIIYNIQKQKSKLKNGLYDISSCIDREQIRYHWVIEWGHGKFLDTRKLSLNPMLFFPSQTKKQLYKTYDDYETACDALERFKTSINHKSVKKDRSKKRNTFAV